MNQEELWLLKEKYDGVESKAFHADLTRLRTGEPLGYVIGHVPFLNTTIHLDSHPLIPRSETEFWAEKAVGAVQCVAPQAPRVLDLCAGSGAIGIALAKAVPTAHITFGEIEKAHISTINKNIQINDLSDSHCTVVQSDLFSQIDGSFDFIFSNPPYIDPSIDRAELSVKAHEPHIALYGGVEGLEIIQRIIAEASKHLNPKGQLWIEHEPEQAASIQRLGHQSRFNTTTHNDQYDLERYSILVVE